MTKKERADRRERCKAYLRQAGGIPAAKRPAGRDLFAAYTSIWAGALGELLAESMARKEGP